MSSDALSGPFVPTPSGADMTGSHKRKKLILGLVLLLVAVWLGSKGWIVAAVVNGRPIFRWQLSQVLLSRFGSQTLEGMISEALIADAASRENIRVSRQDIDAKVNEIVKSLGENVSLEEMLSFQGMTKEDFESQIRLQMTVEKLLGKDIAITEDDIDNYIATNRALLVATEPAALREEAKAAIETQKISEKVQPWFLELKDKAKILRLL